MFFDKKEAEADRLLMRHAEIIGEVLREFKKMFACYMRNEKAFKEQAYKVHTMEHEADMVRREIAVKLNEGAFLPVYREDYVALADRVDKIANGAESVGDYIVLTRPAIPDFLVEDFQRMVDITLKTYGPLEGALGFLHKNMDEILEIRQKVGEGEQEVDKMVWDMTKHLFKSDLDLALKLHIKGLLDKVANLSNRIEDVADQLEVMVIKRQF